MSDDSNRQIRLATRPDGKPDESNFELVETTVPEPGTSELLVETIYLSVDPYMRKMMAGPWEVGEAMEAGVVGRVVESNVPEFSPGDVVEAGYPRELDWADYSIAHASDVNRVDPDLAPISTALGVLGMPGRTGYFGMLDGGEPQPGDTVVVSAAAGAVGSVAAQVAKLSGARVVGIAGSDEKIAWLTGELGLDDGINYATTDDLAGAIGDACGDGVDVYLDLVGGEITDAVVEHLTEASRIAAVGQISTFNEEGVPTGPRLLPRLHYTRVVGVNVNHYEYWYDRATQRMAQWIEAGDLKYRETVTEGLENAPEAFIGLFEGENIGKQLVEVSDAGTGGAKE